MLLRLLVVFCLVAMPASRAAAQARPPNVVLIFCDDLGYGDVLEHAGGDPGETNDLASAHPEVIERLMQFAEAAREGLGDKLTGGHRVRRS